MSDKDFRADKSKQIARDVLHLIANEYAGIPPDQILVALCMLLLTISESIGIQNDQFKSILDMMVDDYITGRWKMEDGRWKIVNRHKKAKDER